MTIAGRSMDGGIQVSDNITFKTSQGKHCCVNIIEERLTASAMHTMPRKVFNVWRL